MEHSQANLEDAGKVVDAATKPDDNNEKVDYNDERSQHNDKRSQKRKANGQQYGSRGGRNDGKRHKKGDMGRGEYFRDGPDKRTKSGESREKREGQDAGRYGVQYSKEEIEAEERKPKRKVAVLIGYAGTGYKGMQITPTEKTIEGDLFQAFIKAGAISKANADDPKKAGLVRCARTDKGVHAAGNMISLKLIVEDEDIVEKINAELTPQIRVWGIERTIGSFSCYQACDSRWYEYLIPTHAFLPPHPSSWLAKKLEELADLAGDREGYEGRQEEVKGFWERIDEGEIQAVLAEIDEDLRWDVVAALQGEEEAGAKAARADADVDVLVKFGKSVGGRKNKGQEEDEGGAMSEDEEQTVEAAIVINEPAAAGAERKVAEETESVTATAPSEDTASVVNSMVDSAISLPDIIPATDTSTTHPPATSKDQDRLLRLKAATKSLRAAYLRAKRRYRIPSTRVVRIQEALDRYVGTNNFHNFTIQKSYRDPSAKRHIKSFKVNPTPILIGEGADEEKSEWLSLKVHGQSFMMHQIRKMVGMVALLVRCGSNLDTLTEAMGAEKFSIPKVPGLGLLLERPVFDSYNTLHAPKHGREALMFSKFETELEAFKAREIYQRIFREEEERNEFGRFFNHVDNFKEGYFLFVGSMGVKACGMDLGRGKEGGVGGEKVGVEDVDAGAIAGDGGVAEVGQAEK
ncbi:tRNA pseudouridine synthase 1 [Recurvomyces mirabilis]|uniref:tRNA pseudouridine synthase 1 n=1 Tax=Recurvomyces mirabilis TaxID=574656 RepID=A0AAE0WQN6_9PEZI|nr:tRNA pseudouridine synthase 1 [Recurvomyces mirabilis]KAK5154010.1 tRNA pseudouridine synthase 1 [Recurvomyces mirabilis]